jgi:hypothetical protein
VPGFDHRLIAALRPHLHPARSENPGSAAIRRNLVLPEQEIDAPGVAVDHLLPEDHHLSEIELRLDPDAHLREGVPRLGIELGCVEKRLRGNASDVETGAAMRRPLIDDRHLHAELCCPDGAYIASGTGADDDEIEAGHLKICSPLTGDQVVTLRLLFGIVLGSHPRR